MANRVAWYDRRWVMPALAILTFVTMPFQQDIRDAITGVANLGDWLLDSIQALGLVGLVIVLVLRSNQAARTCEGLREHFQQSLANSCSQLEQQLANERKQLHEKLSDLTDSRLKPILEELSTLQSNMKTFDSRLSALDSRLGALDSRIAALTDMMNRSKKPT